MIARIALTKRRKIVKKVWVGDFGQPLMFFGNRLAPMAPVRGRQKPFG
jgi:hypothetical protein